MIDGKVLKFGYGDISVRACGFAMTFTPFNPPVDVGTNARGPFASKAVQPIGETISIKFKDFKDFAELTQNLRMACFDEAFRVFKFKGYTFDFSNYNEKSVGVVDSVLCCVYQTFMSCAAC